MRLLPRALLQDKVALISSSNRTIHIVLKGDSNRAAQHPHAEKNPEVFKAAEQMEQKTNLLPRHLQDKLVLISSSNRIAHHIILRGDSKRSAQHPHAEKNPEIRSSRADGAEDETASTSSSTGQFISSSNRTVHCVLTGDSGRVAQHPHSEKNPEIQGRGADGAEDETASAAPI